MLKKLQIKNFKRWEDTGEICLAPISIFFGANSSGKSSIGQFLMMLKQTSESQNKKVVFYPGGKNTPIQLGSYREMVSHRNPENAISFNYQWKLPYTIELNDALSQQVFTGDTISFAAKTKLSSKDKNNPLIEEMRYILHKGNSIKLELGMKLSGDEKDKYEMIDEKSVLKRKQMRACSLKTPIQFYGFPDEVVAYHKNADFVQDLNLAHENFFHSIYYLGPLREKAERFYSWSGLEPESVGYNGELTIAAILAAQKREIGLLETHKAKKTEKMSFEKVIALKLKEMGLIEKFSIKQISDHRQEYEVKICPKGSRDEVDLPDVGVGISQVLPVLVQCFCAPPNSIIILEQPEIHLHPKAQSALADLMIDVIMSKENDQNRNIQLIIETHSEYFLRRIQRRIAENIISHEKVAAYFADVTKPTAQLEELQVDDFGNIRNWPDGFFGDEMEDITAQTKAAMEKLRKMRENKAGASE